MTAPLNPPRTPPIRLAGIVVLLITAVILTFVIMQFRGTLKPKTYLTMLSARAGLVMDPGSKVTYNGVAIGRVDKIEPTMVDGKEAAKFSLEVEPKFIKLIPTNVQGEIQATTIFGNKYVSLSSPSDPTSTRINSSDVIDVRNVTTEFNTVFETVTNLAEKIDPVKLNLTLSATAEALTGLGTKLGETLVQTNVSLDNLNPRLPRLQYGLQRLAEVADIYTGAGPDFWDSLDNALTTIRTLNNQQGDLDATLLGAIGFGNAGAEVFENGGPYLVRAMSDLNSDLEAAQHLQPRVVLHAPQVRGTVAGRPGRLRRQRLLARRPCLPGGRAQPVCLPGQPAAGERARWTRWSARLLADSDQGVLASADPGCRHRCLARAVQPLRTRTADPQ